MSLDCVVDASVGCKLFVVESLSDRADALFDQLARDPPARLYVPDLFFVECGSILWKYVQRHSYSAEDAHHDVLDLVRLPLRAVPVRELIGDAMALSLAYGITAYDAVYVALSRQLSLPLVTADQVLLRRLVGSPFDLRYLGEWP